MRNNIYKYLFLLLLCLPTGLLAQNRYWVNGSGEWNNSNHWSETSGGKGGASVPNLKNAVIFDSNSSNNSFVVDIMKSAGAYSVDVKSGVDLSLNSNSDINFAYKESIDRVFRNQFIGNLIDLSNVQSESRSRSSRAYSLNVVSVKPVSCAGAMDGEIEFEAIGSGVTKFQFAWFNTDYFTSGQIVTTSTSAKFTGMFPGSIILFIKDADGAAPYPLLVQSFAVVGSPAALELSKDDIVSVNPTCSGSANGSLVATAKGGNLPYTYILDPGNVSNSTGAFNNLADGTYSVRVDDANGCGPVTVNNISIKEPNPIAITNVDLKHVDCYNAANGQITVTATGGNDLEYSIDGVTFKNIGESFSGLATASYTITVRDKIDNSCKLVDGPYLISQPADIVFSETLSDYNGFNISCPGNNDGSINVTGTGGESNNLEYSIGAAFKNVGSSFGSLAAGNYTITIRDKDNPTCTKTKDITLTEPNIISIASTVANVKCFGGSDGKIDVVSSQGVAPYVVTLTKLPAAVVATKMGASVSFDNLTLGSYKIDVVDANGCSQSKNVTVTQPNEIVVSEIIKNLTCFNSNNGSIEVVVNDGTPNYVLELKYQANGTTQTKTGVTAGAASSFENLVAGNYVLTVDDANSCVKTENYIVTEPAIITPTINVKSVTCFSGSNGEISVSVSGGTPPYKVVVDNIAASISKTEVGMALNEARSFTNLVAGSYVITISDFNSCSTIENKDISQPTEISIDFTPSHVTCFGGNDGSVSVKVTNGTPNYTVELFNTDDILINTVLNVTSISPAVFNTLIAGDYYIKVTDANNCEKLTSNFSITQPTEIVVNNFVLQNLTCSGSGNGKISLNISGGNAPYKVDISKGAFNQSKSNIAADVEFDNLESGLFNVLITDAVGCQISKSYTLTEPNSFTVDRVITDASCFQGDNGEIEITVTGGTAPYVLELTGGAITKTESGVAENAKTTFTNLTAQSYSVKILDVNNCEIVVNYTVNQPAEIALTGLNTIKPLCFSNADGKIVFNIIGGTPLYNVFLLKEDGSQYAQLTSVNQAELLEFSAVSAGNYTIKVVDAKLCEKEFPVVVDQPAPIVIKLNSVDNVSCNAGNNGRIAFEVSGGTPLYSVDLLNSAGATILTRNNFAEATEDIFVDLVADTYKIKVVDDNGCQKEYTDIVITQPQPIVLVPTVNNLSCFESSNGSIQFSISGGTAVYTVQLFDMASAEVAKLENVLENESKSFDNLSIGTYSIKVTDIATCTNLTENITLTQPEKLISTAVVQKNASCFGDANGQILATVVSGGVAPFQVSIDGGANFNFTDGLIDNIAAGDYQVIIKDANGCMSETVSLTVTQPEKLIATFDVTNVICKNDNSGTITVNPTGGTAPYEYSIDYKPFVINNFFDGLQANDYIIAVKDANGCIFAQTVVVTEPLNGLKIRTVNSKNIFSCNGNLEGEIIFTATSEFAITYYIDGPVSLNNTTGIFENLPAGDYDIYVTDESGCTVMHTKQIAITQPSELVFDYINVTNFLPTSCAGDKQGKIFVKASGGVGPYQFSIDGVNYTTSREFNNLDGGKYEVYVKDANGCITMQEVTITAPLPIVITSVVAQNPLCFTSANGKIVVVAEGGTGNLNYKINGGAAQDNGTFDNLAAGNYTVTVTDENNCSFDSDLIVLSSPEQIIIEAQVKKYPKGETTADGEMFVKVTGGVNSFIVSLDKTDAPALVIPAPANTSEFLFTGLLAGEYTVHVSDANGCSDITLDFTLEPFKITLSADDVKCFGESNGKISVLVEGGKAPFNYSYFIKPDGKPINTLHNNYPDHNDSLDNLPAGDYIVTVTESNGDVVTKEITVGQPAEITSTETVINNNCFGESNGSVEITIGGGTAPYQVTWSSASLAADVIQDNIADITKIDKLLAGEYTASVVDAAGCNATFKYEVTQPTKVVAFAEVVSPLTDELASNGEIKTTATGGSGNYLFSLKKVDDVPATIINGNAVFSTEYIFQNLLGKDYQAFAIDENGCASDPTNIILTTFKVEGTANQPCFGSDNGSISLTITNGVEPFNIQWTNSAAETSQADDVT
ncbi:MAG: SprB repeat-containing protein, partial [Bacteroidales bacterium]|nr:SprB repeat-containing protein [Bacteroidales bacterium]